jgi:hypothetical protein
VPIDDETSDQSPDDDSDWPDPPTTTDRDPRRLHVRLLCSVVVFALFVVLSADLVVDVLAVLWPPHESLSRWATLVLLQLFGYVLLPLLVGGFLGDVVYDHVLER